MNPIVSLNCIENIYVGPRGFYDVVFHSPEDRNTLLVKVPMFFDKQLVHVMQWSPGLSCFVETRMPCLSNLDYMHAF